MARPIRPAIDSTLIFGSLRPASVSGMVLVTTTSARSRLRNSLDRRSRQHGMRGAGIHLARARVQQRLTGLHQRARRVDDVVEDETGAPVDVADHVHHLGHVHFHAALVDNGQRRIHLLGEEACALHATRIRRNHGQVRELPLAEVVHQHRRRKQVVHRNVEKALNLRRVQIDH